MSTDSRPPICRDYRYRINEWGVTYPTSPWRARLAPLLVLFAILVTWAAYELLG
jgi:hypothetical protein